MRTYFRHHYAAPNWLRKKQNPVGWMCAQTRPAQGLHKAMARYKRPIGRTNATSSDKDSGLEPLPDYLIIMDDDTYYNMELFEQHFQNHDIYRNSSMMMGIAGCMVRGPWAQLNFTFPFGGYGFIMSKGYLQRLHTPIFCEDDPSLCQVIKAGTHLRESSLFSEGMSLMDLMYAYVTHQPYSEYKKWTTGFCLHSDWYVTEISKADKAPFWVVLAFFHIVFSCLFCVIFRVRCGV